MQSENEEDWLAMSEVDDDDGDPISIREILTIGLAKRPYDARIYLKRAHSHQNLEYFDLAVGDAYKALLLTDEILYEGGEYHDQALHDILQSFPCTRHTITDEIQPFSKEKKFGRADEYSEEQENSTREQNDARSVAEAVATDCSRSAYCILIRNLIETNDLKSALDFIQRGLKAFPGFPDLTRLKDRISEEVAPIENPLAQDSSSKDFLQSLPGNGSARREIYPWNFHELDRFSESNMSFLNEEMGKAAPKCEIRAVELPCLDENSPSAREPINRSSKKVKQLGLFSTSEIQAGETVLLEPSILTASNRLHDPFCDACSSPLPSPSANAPLPTCPQCNDTTFCSPYCESAAYAYYHPAVCGTSDFDVSAKDPSPRAATDSLYLLLLARTIAMAETQEVHPLDLREIKYLWGDFTNNNPAPTSIPTATHHIPITSQSAHHPRTLPFSFNNNILAPIHLLENLGLDIFAAETRERYDIWVINTLVAKYRGVASARMNPRTGIPEACAVHWRWSMINHSCAPNVRWEWPASGALQRARLKAQQQGTVELGSDDVDEGDAPAVGGCVALIARGGEEVVQWGGDLGNRKGGIKKGEEVLNHYCDIELSVQDRREWAAGALGGVCMCERCVWESEDAKDIKNRDPTTSQEDRTS